MKIDKILSIVWLGFLLPHWGFAQELEGYLQEAAENNPGLKASYAQFEAALERVNQARVLPDPQLSFGYFISPVETRVGPQRAKLGLSQMFPWFGTLSAKEQVAAKRAEAKYLEFISARDKLFFDVKSSWYPLYYLNEQIRIQREYEQILASYKRLATTGFEHGKASMVDVVRVSIMLENVATNISILEDKLNPLETRFNLLLNRPDTTEVIVPKNMKIKEIPKDYRKDSLVTNHPGVLALERQIESAEAQERVARKSGLPQFGVGVDYVIVGMGPLNVPDNGRDAFMPMVSLSLPIYRKRYTSAVAESKHIQTALSLRIDDYENSLLSNYEQAQFELQSAIKLFNLYSTQTSQTRQAIELLVASYGQTGEGFEEVLRMQQELLKYQIEKARVLSDYFIAAARIDYLTSKAE